MGGPLTVAGSGRTRINSQWRAAASIRTKQQRARPARRARPQHRRAQQRAALVPLVPSFPRTSARPSVGAGDRGNTLGGSDGRFHPVDQGWLTSRRLHQHAHSGRLFASRSGGHRAAAHPRCRRGRGGVALDEVTLGRPRSSPSMAKASARRGAAAHRRELAALPASASSSSPRRRARLRGHPGARRAGAGGRSSAPAPSDLTLMRSGRDAAAPADRRGDVVAAHSTACPSVGRPLRCRDHAPQALCRASARLHLRSHAEAYDMPMSILGKLLSWHEMSLHSRSHHHAAPRSHPCTAATTARHRGAAGPGGGNLGFTSPRHRAAKICLSHEESARIPFEEARIAIDEPISRAEFERLPRRWWSALDDCVTRLLLARGRRARRRRGLPHRGSSQLPAVHRLFTARFGEGKLRTADALQRRRGSRPQRRQPAHL